MWFVVAASAAGGAIVGSRPTGLRTADVVLTAAFAGLVALAGAYARRWSWLVVAGIALAAAGSGREAVWCAVGAIVIGFVAVAFNARSLGMGAAAAGLAVQALLRLPDFAAQGVPSLLAALAVVPLCVSAYRYAPGRGRRRARKYAFYAGALSLALLGIGTIAGLLARAHVEDGISGAQSGFDNVQHGERDASVAALNQSAADFDQAADILGSWWAAPVRALPLVGQQIEAVHTMAQEGHTLAIDASQAAGVIDYEQLRLRGGAIDIELLRAVQAPITNTAAALAVARDHLAGLSVGWLVPPIRQRFDALTHEIDRAAPAAAVARDIVALAPEMLGADTPQHYLVLFGSPAETRELGGFVGNFAEVTADKGKLRLTKSGRSLELSDPKGNEGRSLTPGDYTQPFAPYRVTQFFGNVSASPNFSDVGNVVDQLYPQAGGPQLDGVFYMDPYALAQLLELTGPVTLKDSRTKLTSRNAAQTLFVDQYVNLPEHGERVDFLDEVTRVTFERLTSGDLPKPVRVADVMSPMVDQGRFFAQSSHPQIEALFQQLAFDGSIPSRNGGDYLAVTQSNENPSKIDAYLQRDVTYDATYFPDTGQVDGVVRIKLTNSAPDSMLPNDVIGNANGLPPGTNHLFLNVYSPLGATGATVNGAATGVGSVQRFGLSVYTFVVDVPPKATVTVELKLAGIVARSRDYQLTVVRQPTVNADHIDVTLSTRGGWRLVSFPGFQLDKGTGKATVGEARANILTAHLDTQ